MVETNPFKAYCKQLRLSKNLTLNSYANKLGFSASYVSNKESGTRGIPTEYIEAIVKFIGLNKKEERELKNAWLLTVGTVTFNVSELSETQKKDLIKVINNCEGFL